MRVGSQVPDPGHRSPMWVCVCGHPSVVFDGLRGAPSRAEGREGSGNRPTLEVKNSARVELPVACYRGCTAGVNVTVACGPSAGRYTEHCGERDVAGSQAPDLGSRSAYWPLA